MKKYAYISYNGKTLTVNENEKPESKDFGNQAWFGHELRNWQSNCKTIDIAEGHNRQFKDYCFIKHTMSVYDLEANPVLIDPARVRLEEIPLEQTSLMGSKIYKYVETAFFIPEETEKEEENEAVLFADFLLADYEMSHFEDGREDGLCWQLCGTGQKYTTKELYNIFKQRK